MRALTSVGPHQPTLPRIVLFAPGRRTIHHRWAWAIDQAVSPAAGSNGSPYASCTRQISLLIAFDLPTIPPPTTALPFRHGRFRTLLHRRDLPCLSPGQTLQVGGIAVTRSRVRALAAASPTGLAESSSHTLRTGHSSQVALHLSSWKRSYHFRLQAGNVRLGGDFHPPDQTPSQAHCHWRLASAFQPSSGQSYQTLT